MTAKVLLVVASLVSLAAAGDDPWGPPRLHDCPSWSISRGPGPFDRTKICAGDEKERERFDKELVARIATERAAVGLAAQREVVLPVILALTRMRDKNERQDYCLKTFDDLLLELQGVLRDRGHNPAACSPDTDRQFQATGEDASVVRLRDERRYVPYRIMIERVWRADSGEFAVIGGYSCGTLCGGTDLFRVSYARDRPAQLTHRELLDRY